VKKIRYGESARHLADSGVEMLTVEEYEKIRRAHYIEQKSIRQIAREQGHSRKTVKKALASAGQGATPRKAAREAPVLGPYKERIEALLVEARKCHASNATPATRSTKSCEVQATAAVSQAFAAISGSGDANTRHLRCICRWSTSQAQTLSRLGEGLVVMKRDSADGAVVQHALVLFPAAICHGLSQQKMESFLEAQVSAFHFFEGVPHRISYDNLKPP